jgi:DNA invertase Pin-like site-specific DNA recombinase
MLQEVDYPDGSWRKGNGRKSAEETVKEWQAQHPECKNKSLCARDTGLSRPTVIRWWNKNLLK